jgi:hypothetical protein
VFLIFFCVIGSWIVASAYLFVLQTPMDLSSDAGASDESSQNAAHAVRTVWVLIWMAGTAMLLMGSHMWYTAAYYGELAENPRTGSETLALRCCALLLWAGGACWIWALLRARHAVTLGVMLTMVSERALEEVGTSTIYWVSFGHAVLATLFLFLMT